MKKILTVLFLLCLGQAISPIFARSFPDSLLPEYIKAVVDSGERPDWSIDGTKVLFLNHSGGDAFEVEVATKKVRPITSLWSHPNIGYWRALYLSNGDYFITGGSDRNNTYAWIIDKGLTKAPVKINTIIREGPAISRTNLKLCYTSDMDKINIADIVYTNGVPSFANSRMIIDRTNISLNGAKVNFGSIEPQNFRPKDETQLTFSAYGYNGTDAILFTMGTGKFYNITNEPCYDEPEGIFPDGQYTLVECNRHVCMGEIENLDIYLYSLSDPSKWVRLTYFSNVATFKASNPVVRDDGKYFSFMESRSSAASGVGYGIYVFDLVAAEYANPPVSTPTNTPPACSFATPINGASLTDPANISVTVNASDADGSVSKVDLYKNDVLVRSEVAAPYNWNVGTTQDAALQNLAAGTYTLKAIATDNSGATTSSIIVVTVKLTATHIQIKSNGIDVRSHGESNVQIINLRGQVVQSERVVGNRQMNIDNLAPGVYQVLIQTEKGITCEKMVR